MSDLSKIEAWIQQQDDELLYDVDGERAYQESLYALDVVTLDGRIGTVHVADSFYEIQVDYVFGTFNDRDSSE